jgi:hypothetical protein
MAKRYIVRFRSDAPIKEIWARIDASPSVNVIEQTPKMLLVEADEADLLDVVKPSAQVAIIPEGHYERPDTRPLVREQERKSNP